MILQIPNIKHSKTIWWAGIFLVVGIYLFAQRPTSLVDGESAGRTIPIEEMFRIVAAENDTARKLYTMDIVGAGMKVGLDFSEKWRETDVAAGPLPALFLREAATSIQTSTIPLGLFLGSDFPIAQSNKFIGTQAERFKMMRDSSQPQFFYSPELELQVAMFADLAIAPGCVTCHNEHPKSPKVDWKLGDIMGATTWSYPKDKVTLDEMAQIISAYRGGVVSAYEAYLAKAAKFSKPPEVGDRWPKDGYFLPSKDLFIKEFERLASGNTISLILQANSPSKVPD
jgi:adenylate cyclase